MKPLEISYQQDSNALYLQGWIHLTIGILYIGLYINSYWQDTNDWASYLFLVSGSVLIAVSIFAFLGITFKYPKIILNNEGIAFGKRKNLKIINWSQIYNINIDNHSISLHLKTDKIEELDIGYFEYKQLQSIKNKLRQFADARHVSYHSEY